MAHRRKQKDEKKKRPPKRKSKFFLPKEGIISFIKDNKKRVAIILVIIILLASVVTAGIIIYFVYREKNDWTLIVYMSGDNTLSPIVDVSLDQIETEGVRDDTKVIVLYDKNGNDDAGLVEFKGNSRNNIPLKNIDPTWATEVDMGHYDVFNKFLTWAIKEYPSSRLMLSMWSHGDNWESFCRDKNTYLRVAQFSSTLKAVCDSTGKDFDIIALDSCSMASIEVCYELRHYADYCIASEKDIPSTGFPYHRLVRLLNAQKSPETVSTAFVDAFVEEYESGKLQSKGESVALSSIDLSKMNTVKDEFIEFKNGLEDIEDFKVIIARNRAQEYEFEGSIDMIDFLDHLSDEIEPDLMNVVSDSIVNSKSWFNPTDIYVSKAQGLTLYFPSSQDEYNSEYRSLAFAKDTGWNEKIQEYY